MIQLSQKAAQAFTMLRGHRDFDVILEWIKENRDAETELCCEQVDDALLKRAQGGRKALQHILKASVEAPKILEKFTNK